MTLALLWATGWGFLAIYTDISPSVSHWVGFLAIYTDISPSVSHWVVVSRYIHWHFTFSESLGGGFLLYTLTFHLQLVTGWVFSLYTLTFHLQWVTGWRFLAIYTDISHSVSHWVAAAIYTDISHSVSHWVGVSCYIHWYFTFSEPLGGVSCYIYWHFTFSEPLGGGFSVYTLTFHLQWVTGWWFLAIYTDISPSVSHWVGFLAIYTDISPSVSHWVAVSCYIHWHFTFS